MRPPPALSCVQVSVVRSHGRNSNMDKMIAVFQRNTVCFNIPESSPKAQQAAAVWNADQTKAHMHIQQESTIVTQVRVPIHTSFKCIICPINQEFQIFVSVHWTKILSSLIQEYNAHHNSTFISTLWSSHSHRAKQFYQIFTILQDHLLALCWPMKNNR